MKRKLLSLILAVAMCLSLCVPAMAAGSDLPFQDVSSSAWYAQYVSYAWKNGLINGTSSTKFSPSGALNIASAVTLAARMYQLYHDGEVTLTSGQEKWYSTYVDFAKQVGIIDAREFNGRWEENITRSDFVKIFYAALPQSEYAPMNRVDDDMIPDVLVSDPCGAQIYAFYRAGILTGSSSGNWFFPDKTIARSEVAAIVSRMFDPSLRLELTLADPTADPTPEPEPEPEPEPQPEPEPEPQPEPEPEPKPTPSLTGTFMLVNNASGRLLDVYGNTSTSTNRSNVQIYDRQNGTNLSQQFQIKQNTRGWYNIAPLSNAGLHVNPYSDTPTNNTNVNVYTASDSDKTQGWIFEASGDAYIIRSAYNTKLVLAATGTTNMSDVRLATYNGSAGQLWKLIEVASQEQTTSTVKISLNVPLYKQGDTRWKNTVYDPKCSDATIGVYGCLLTSTSMVYSYTTGTTTYPDQMMKKLSFNGNGELIWNSFTKLGYTNTGAYKTGITQAIMQKIYTQLSNNKPVIIGGKTSSGSTHWVVVTGYTGTNTNSFQASSFTINDPSFGYTTLAQFLNKFPTVLSLAY